MNLNREPVAGVEELHEPGEERTGRGSGTEQVRAFAFHQLPKRLPRARPAGHHALVQRMVTDLPGFAVILPRRQRFSQDLPQAPAAPYHRPQKWMKAKRSVHRFFEL